MQVHIAERTDRLADDLARLLATPLPDVFAEELVVVPAKGVERWLTQRMSHHLGVGPAGGDGVCAGVRFVNPRSLVALLMGTDRADPWDPSRLVWPVLEAIDASVGEPWCSTLARHLGHGVDGEDGDLRRDRRWSVARRVAGLFAAYAVQRPQLVTDWSAGADRDGMGQPLADDLRWQAELWRRVVAPVDGPAPQDRHRDTLAAIRAGRPLALPDRLSLFGHTRLPVTEVELVRAVSEVRDVHLWLPTASPTAWSTLAETVAVGPIRRREDDSVSQVGHPLLSSLGRDSRELQRSLTGLGRVDIEVAPPATGRSSLLGWLQADLRSDQEPDDVTRLSRVVDEGDRSVQVHAAHGTARQVEVLREVLVGLLEDDRTLEPRDILVMCPNIDVYAPLVHAAFGLGGVVPGGHPAHGLRVRLADRGLARTNPLLALAAEIIHLAGGRATLTEVLGLAASEPVRQRFGFSDDDLATMTSWAEQSGVRWGLNERLRTAYRLDFFPQNTWSAGLDRLLLGVAMAEDEQRVLGTALPLDDVPSAQVGLAGRLAELVERLESCVESLLRTSELADWVRILRDGVLSIGAASPADAWQTAQFERELASVAAAGQLDGAFSGPTLRLADLRSLLADRSAGRPTRANFRTGALTVCTMVPMRSVPHRVVCLIGLDDGVFPRTGGIDGDDVLARDPVTGERDLRSEDRQLLLDAVLAAKEHLVITYSGANEHTGQVRPPSVPLGEVLDALDVTAAGPVREQVVVRHPLQPFDPRNVTPGALVGATSFSFDRAALRGARAAAAQRHPPRPFLIAPLAATDPVEDVALADLQAFFAHPVRRFLRGRLDVAVSQDVEEPDDAMPIELDALTKWGVGDRILRRVISGADPGDVLSAELFRGELPPGTLGDRVLGDVTEKAKALLEKTEDLRGDPPGTVEADVDLGDGRRLSGSVGDVRGDRIVRVHYSSLGPKHRLASWVDLLALAAAHPETGWSAWTVGWDSRARRPVRSVLGPVEESARALLLDLVEIFDRGMREPLPLPLRAGHAWAQAVREGKDPTWAARNEWEGNDRSPLPGEAQEREHVRVFGPGAPFTTVAARPALDEGWNEEPTRLGRYAVRVWTPLIDHERRRTL